ncbi:hypothetical protein KC842_01075 [Candidatus Nomurabacteria bacterium]|nr:hypothetical protein [Candidatus Nomurabacteria bacterium]USN94692.1 MAG: hypothetical protein H6791_02965 [Candidatus Nomurabacteria bacterium]
MKNKILGYISIATIVFLLLKILIKFGIPTEYIDPEWGRWPTMIISVLFPLVCVSLGLKLEEVGLRVYYFVILGLKYFIFPPQKTISEMEKE